MYLKNRSPQGLFIENGIIHKELDTLKKGYENFYMQPNGIFYITNDNKAVVSTTIHISSKNIKYATQSRSMLLINNKVNDIFKIGPKNLNIRNGILPNVNILFAIPKQKTNYSILLPILNSKYAKMPFILMVLHLILT